MSFIHENEVNKVSECNLIHDILNPSKRTGLLNIHYYPILHGCMNTRKGRETFKNFLILFHSGFGSTIVIKILITKIDPIEDAVVQRHTQAGNIITNIKVKIYFTLLELRATKIMMWDCRLDYFTKGRYDMILGRYILTALCLNIKFSDHVIEADEVPLKVQKHPWLIRMHINFKF